MSLAVAAFAIAFSLILLAGWLALLSAPLIAASAVVASVPTMAVVKMGSLLYRATDVREGILVIDGLADSALDEQVRTDVARVLELAPAGSRPKACACVRQTNNDSVVGVMRVFNATGHYLLRTTGDTIAGVAQSITTQLRQLTEFPAQVGVKRPACADCAPSRCPLKLLAQRRAMAAA